MSRNYLDNTDTYIELCFWKIEIYAFKDKSIKPSDTIGNAIRLTTEGLSKHSNFNGYTWKEDMIGNGIESMIKGLNNFDEQKFMNPHGYMSMSAENAFLQTMEKEDRELLATYKTFLINHRDNFENEGFISSAIDEKFVQDMSDRVTSIEGSIERKKVRRKLLKMKRELTPLSYMVFGEDISEKIDDEIKKSESFYKNRIIDYQERGRLLIKLDTIKEAMGIKVGTVCVGDVTDYLYKFRKMEIDENQKMNNGSYVDITFIEYDNNDFVDIKWGTEDE